MTTRTFGPRVLVDATAVPANRSGVGRYLDGLLSAVECDLVIACQKRDEEYYQALAPQAHVLPQKLISSSFVRLLWEQFTLPTKARRAKATVIFSPHYTTPLFTTLPRVVTFHDATFFSEPDVHTRLKRCFFRAWIRVSARLARGVIVPSEATANELKRYVTGNITYSVALHGVDHGMFKPPTPPEIDKFRSDFGIGEGPWIGFLGTIEPRKNVPSLIRAYSALAGRWTKTWGDVPTLVLAGGHGWENGLDTALSEVLPPGKVLGLGFVTLDHLRAFLGGAEVVCYPSFGEGFGLPVLEAMACGAAVLTTRRLAIPEVGGEAVAYTDVSINAIEAGLEILITHPKERTRLSAAGLERAAQFTWRASAAIHESVFRSAMNYKRRE